MAEENLNIRIGADNAIAVASIRQLQAIIRDLEERLAAAAIQAASTNAELAALGQKNIATYQAAIAEVNQQIAAQRDEVGAIRATTTALREQEAAATGASRAMAGGAAIIAAQQRASAAASAATTIAPRAIGGGAGIIAAQQRASAAAEREALAERNRLNAMSTRLQDAFAAEQLRTVAKQNEINRLNERAQAAFAAQEQRAARGAPAQPIRALEQGRMEALAVPMTAANLENLEYNRRLKFRAEQEREALDKWRLINTFNQRVQAEQDKAAIRAPEGRIAAATSPGVAAGEAAARATIRGAPPEVVSRVSNEAAMAALARQEQAIKAVAAARMAAAAAGASASEVELAAIGAVTLALRGEGTAAQSSGIAGFFQREIRHIVGLFDSLARGQRGQAISSIGAAARDAGLGVSTLVTSMGGLIALMGTAAILRGAESMGRWARETRALGVATGMTTQQVSGIQAVLTSFGMKADEADASIQHFAKQLAEALADPTSQAAQAFDNLNVKYADLKRNGQDVYGALLLLANGLAITEGGAYQAANAAQLLGNSDRHLIEALQDGADTFRKNVAEQEKMGRVLHDNTGRALEEAGDAVEHLTKKVGGDATQAFERWSGVLKTTGQVLETLSGIIFGTIGLVGKLIEVLGEAPAKAAQATAEVTRALTAQAPPSEKAVETVQARSVMAPGPPSFRPFGLTAEQEVLIKGGATPAEARAKAPGFSYGDTHHPPDLPSGERPGPRVKPVAIPATGFYGEAIPKLPAKPLIPKGEMPTEAEKAHLREVQAGLVAANAAKTTRAAREADDKAEVASLQARVTAAKAAVQATGKDPAKDPSKEQIIAETDLATKMKQLRMQTLADQAAGAKSATAAAKQAAHQSYEEFAGAEKLKISEAQGSSSKIIAIYDEWLQAVSSTYRQGLTLLRQYTTTVEAIERAKVQAVTAARLQEIKEGARLEEQQNRLSVVMGRAQTIAAGGAAKQPEGGTAALAAEASQIEANAQKEVAALMSVMTTAAKGSSVQKEAAQEVLSVVTQAKTQEIELYNKAAEAAKKAAAAFTKFFDSLGASSETLSGSLLTALVAPQQDLIKAGLRTIKFSERGQEVRAAFNTWAKSIMDDAMKGIETGLSQLIAKPLANLLEQQLTPGEGIGGVLGGAAQKALGLGVQAPQAAQFGLGMTSTDPFTGALTKATAVLESHAAATATDTSATTTGTSATLVDTGVTKGSSVATLVDTGVTKGSTVATLVDTGVTKSGTAADLLGMTATQSQTAAILIDTTAVTANATAQSASTGGGILGLLSKIPLIGGLFPHFAAGGIVPGFAAGGIVPSAQGGMVAGGIGGTLALLHPREMVLPAHISEGVQSMIAGGRAGNVNSSNSNTANLNYSPTINTGSRGRAGTGMTRSEFSQLLSLHSGALLGEARNMTRSGWRPA